jgi:hypothetical protein
MNSPAPRYLVWILPRWRDPLFGWRCALHLLGVGTTILLSFALAQGALGWLALLVAVWPYRSVLTVHDRGLDVRWLIFRSTIPIESLVRTELAHSSLGFPRLAVCRPGAPELVFQASAAQLSALRLTLLSTFGRGQPGV